MMEKKKLQTEIIAGLTTFFTMSYIVVVNPSILATTGTGITFSGALTATVLVCFSMTLLMGIYANLPFGVAPGMGINAFFTYSVVLGGGVPWPVALGMVFWSGILFLIASVTPLRQMIALAIPKQLRIAVAVGIGLFLTFIGLKNAGIIVANPATLVTLGTLGEPTLLFILGLLISIILLRFKSPFAFLAGIFAVTLLAWYRGLTSVPPTLVSSPDFNSVFFKLDFVGAIKLAFLPTIVSLFFTDLFDSLSTFIGVSHASGMLDENDQPKNLREGLIVDAFATTVAGLFGSSSGTAYIESAAGVEVGGRTGITAIVTALCFVPCLFIAPLAGTVPPFATAPVLVLVGAMMFRSVSELTMAKLEDVVPAFLIIALIPLTFSITQGILWGLISHVALYVLTGRRKDVRPLMYILAGISIALIIVGHT
ncbi:MAG: NCS2 family permease [Deltaproteobacteria bacterium]|nr:NCS2 family permease [Deltaproteobacteria bacterium]